MPGPPGKHGPTGSGGPTGNSGETGATGVTGPNNVNSLLFAGDGITMTNLTTTLDVPFWNPSLGDNVEISAVGPESFSVTLANTIVSAGGAPVKIPFQVIATSGNFSQAFIYDNLTVRNFTNSIFTCGLTGAYQFNLTCATVTGTPYVFMTVLQGGDMLSGSRFVLPGTFSGMVYLNTGNQVAIYGGLPALSTIPASAPTYIGVISHDGGITVSPALITPPNLIWSMGKL